MASLEKNVARTIKVLGDIKTTIIDMGVEVRDGTVVEEYPALIDDVQMVSYNKGYSYAYDKAYDEGWDVGWYEGYDFGYIEGYDFGKDDGYIEGKQAQYDAFWDAFQQNGNRTDYRHAFGAGWTDVIFKPKYPIAPKDAWAWNYTSSYMFAYAGQSTGNYLDLTTCPIDLTKANPAVQDVFYNSLLKNVYVDISGIEVTRLFNGIDMDRGVKPYTNVTIKCTANTTFSSPFYYANFNKLTFTDDSVIARSGIVLNYATSLSKESIINIIETLSSETTNKTITFNKSAVNNAFGIDVDDETTYTDEWNELIASKSNWTIAFA